MPCIPIKKGKKLPLIQAIQRLMIAVADARDAARDAYRPGLASSFQESEIEFDSYERMIMRDKEEE